MLETVLVRTSAPPLLALLFHAVACVRPLDREVVELPVYEPAAEPTETRIVEVPSDDSDVEAAEPVAAPRRRGTSDPLFFSLGAGYGALGLIELASCQQRGLAGYVRVHVTFNANGHVTRAAAESRVAPPPDALSCIGQQLSLVTVPVFEGGEVTLSRTFFVGFAATGGPPVSL
jgi:hypothetical protein